MKKMTYLVTLLLLALALSGCQGVKSLKEELSGTSRPELGRDDTGTKTVPESMTFSAPYDHVFQSAVKVLTENGASIFEKDSRSGKIVTDERFLEQGSFADRMIWIKPDYKVTEYINIEKSGNQIVVYHKGRFTKILSGMMSTPNQQYPEAETILREKFFAGLSEKLSVAAANPSKKISKVK